VKTHGPFLLLIGFFGLSTAFGQNPPSKTPAVFSLLNLVRSTQPTVLKIGSEPVGEGQMSFGFYTGIVTWLPNVPLALEAPGFGSLRIGPASTGPNECPLFIIQDALEKPPAGGDPKPVLKYLTVANAKDRPPQFIDGINLTGREFLACTIGDKNLSLEKGKRTRLSTANGMRLRVKDGPEVAVSPSEEPSGLLVIFYENLEGKVEFAMANDVLIRP
jgi:hypothetical protein